MPKVVVVAQVEDMTRWEQGFRSHAELFRSMSVTTPIGIAMNPGNEVAVCFEASDLKRFVEIMESQATVEAMAHDGVKRDTVKVFVMDKELQV